MRYSFSIFFFSYSFLSFFLETVTRSIDRFLDTTDVDRLLVNNLINVEAPPTNGMSFIEDTIPPTCFPTLLNRVNLDNRFLERKRWTFRSRWNPPSFPSFPLFLSSFVHAYLELVPTFPTRRISRGIDPCSPRAREFRETLANAAILDRVLVFP